MLSSLHEAVNVDFTIPEAVDLLAELLKKLMKLVRQMI